MSSICANTLELFIVFAKKIRHKKSEFNILKMVFENQKYISVSDSDIQSAKDKIQLKWRTGQNDSDYSKYKQLLLFLPTQKKITKNVQSN